MDNPVEHKSAEEIKYMMRLVDGTSTPFPNETLAQTLYPQEPREEGDEGSEKVLPFRTPTELLLYAYPDFKPYPWQVKDHLWIAGYQEPVSGTNLGPRTVYDEHNPGFYTLCAANGSGKDSVIGAASILWFLCTMERMKVICTSASAIQLTDQTEKPCRALADALNEKLGFKRFSYVQRRLSDTVSRSEVIFFATDDPGKAEGHHPFMDMSGAKMAIILNEVKSLDPKITEAIRRCTGYSYWLEYSSPGAPLGHFYNSCMAPSHKYRKFSHVTAYDCPHISKGHIDSMIQRYGISSPIVRSSIFAEFSSEDETTIIPAIVLKEFKFRPRWDDGLVRCGFDVALGGDESVAYFYKGPKFLACEKSFESDAVKLVEYFIALCKKYGAFEDNVTVDGSGIGKPLMSIFREFGFFPVSKRNDEAPKDKKNYLNFGAESWDHCGLLIKAGAFEMPDDVKLHKELITRRCMRISGKVRLEGKRAARIAGRPSPNRADALVLTWSRTDFDTVKIDFKADETDALRERATKTLVQSEIDSYAPQRNWLYDYQSRNRSVSQNRVRPSTLLSRRR